MSNVTISADQFYRIYWYALWKDQGGTYPTVGAANSPSQVRYGNGYHHPLGLTIPKGSVINHALWTITTTNVGGGWCKYRIKAELAASPAQMANCADMVARRGLTNVPGVNDAGLVTVAQIDVTPAVYWDNGTRVYDVAAILQELVTAFDVANVEVFIDDFDDRNWSNVVLANKVTLPSLHVDWSPGAPLVTTQAPSAVTTVSATLNGTVTTINGANIAERGFVYDTVTRAAPGDVAPGASGYASYVSDLDAFGLGAYTKALTGLTQVTSYFLRAFAKNDTGHYGYSAAEVELHTLFPGSALPVTIASLTAPTWHNERRSCYCPANKTYYAWAFDTPALNVYKSADKGATWAFVTQVNTGNCGFFDGFFDGKYLHFSYNGGNANGEKMYYRRATPQSNGSLVLDGEQTIIDYEHTWTVPILHQIICDKGGYPWVIIVFYDSNPGPGVSVAYPIVYKSSTRNGTWTMAAGFPYLPAAAAGVTLTEEFIAPLANGDVYIVYNAHHGRLWNSGTGWGAEETLNNPPLTSEYSSLVAVGNDLEFAFVSGTNVCHEKRTAGVGWGARSVLQAGVNAGTRPFISKGGEGSKSVGVFWMNKPTINHIYARTRTKGTWNAVVDWISEAVITNDLSISSSYFSDNLGDAMVVWLQDGSKNFKFGGFPIAPPSLGMPKNQICRVPRSQGFTP